ncbi:hypothetical protein [uncultured Dysosmobacter sp.]|uniref:hypothetical protein n=1 Tax=uncultured Dysosmobacter sp. TaxID=2591384 RepID=UPI00260FB770|nr:hypothetical protein [uncultured Dysosmobacter sp.]
MRIKPGMMKKIVPVLERHGYHLYGQSGGVYDFCTEYGSRFIRFDTPVGHSRRGARLGGDFTISRPFVHLELSHLSGLCRFQHADYATQAELDAYLEEIALALEEKILPYLDASVIGLASIRETDKWVLCHALAQHTEERAAACARERHIPLEPTRQAQEMLEAELLTLCPSDPALRGAAFLEQQEDLLDLTALAGELKRLVLREIPGHGDAHWDWRPPQDQDLPDWYPRIPTYLLISRESGRSYDPLAWVLRYWFYAQETNDALPLTNPRY